MALLVSSFLIAKLRVPITQTQIWREGRTGFAANVRPWRILIHALAYATDLCQLKFFTFTVRQNK
jgi:hypothetical protein